jgi:hypothetical protein
VPTPDMTPAPSRTPAPGLAPRPGHTRVREPDELLAPLVWVYLFAVVGWLVAVLLWVFWYRGYA